MTRNQIEYSKHLETQRHNLVSEGQGREQLQFQNLNLAETHRHNLVDEKRKDSELAETVRANKAREVENSTHNRVTEEIDRQRKDISAQTLTEQSRANLENEAIKRAQNQINVENSQRLAASAKYTADVSAANSQRQVTAQRYVADVQSANVSKQLATQTYLENQSLDIQRAQNQIRNDLNYTQLQQGESKLQQGESQLDLSYAKLNEDTRHNIVSEKLNFLKSALDTATRSAINIIGRY